jgi:uncharacterized protein
LRKALEALIELQEIDRQLYELYKAKGDLPQKVESLLDESEKLGQELLKMTTESSEKAARKSSIQNEIAIFKDRLKRYESQLYQVKTNKEYDAITLETENTQKLIDDLELEKIAIEYREADLITQIADLEQKRAETIKSHAEHQTVLQEMMQKTASQEQGLLGRRGRVLPGLNRQITSSYERIRLAKSGVAVAYLRDGSCSECSTRIPPQRSMEIRNMDTLFYCEVCGRILVWRTEE